jgi:hypothetical protein
MRTLALLAIVASATGAQGAGLFHFTGDPPSLRASAQDAAFGPTQIDGKREPTSLPYSSSLNVTQGLSSSSNQISLSDSKLLLNFQHVFDGYNDSFAASAGDFRFKPNFDLHYQVTDAYTFTAPNSVPFKIEQDFSLTGESAQQLFFGSNQGQSTSAGTTTYTAGTDAGTSHIWLGKDSGTLFSGLQYTLAYQSYMQGAAAGVPNGTTANGSLLVDLYYRGDLDGNRSIGFEDLVRLAQNYGTTVGPRGYGNGDIDGDGMVTFVDLTILAQRYGTSPDAPMPINVPEPGTAILLFSIAVMNRRAKQS